MRLQLLTSLLVATTGCLVGGGVRYHAAVVAPPPPVVAVHAEVNAPPPEPVQTTVYVQPDLVEVSPGIQVIADYDEPIFYSDGYYWRSSGGVWYSSRVHTGGWAVATPPARYRTIETRNYVHYRPSGWQPRNNRAEVREPVPVRDHREGYREPVRQPEPAVRDHREGYREPAPAPAPVVRDHREAPPPAPAPVVRDHRESAPPPPPARKDPHTRDHR